MALEHLISTLKQENKSVVSQEIQRRKAFLDKVRTNSNFLFDEIYKQEKEKLENNKKLM